MESGRTLPGVDEFQPLLTTEVQPGVGELMVGEDHRLYRRTKGLLDIICEVAPETEPEIYYGGVNWDEYPKMEYLADFYDRFLKLYEREVMFLVGKLYKPKPGKCPWFFMVPKQTGTTASIKWESGPGMDWFLKYARFLGTVHVHPGDHTEPSGTDLENWEIKVHSGIHVIFGRDESFSLHGSANGNVVNIMDGSVKDLERIRAPLNTSLNESLGKLLLVPAPVKKLKKKWNQKGTGLIVHNSAIWSKEEWEKGNHDYIGTRKNRARRDHSDWEDYLYSVAVMTAWEEPGLEAIKELWLVQDGTDAHLLLPSDYDRYRTHCLVERWDDAPLGLCLAPVHRGGV